MLYSNFNASFVDLTATKSSLYQVYTAAIATDVPSVKRADKTG